MDIKASEDIVQLKELWLPQSWYAERTREKNLFYFLRAFSGTQDYFQSGTSLFLPLIAAQLVEQYQYHGILFNCELKEFIYFSPEKEETTGWEAGLSKFNALETVFVNEDIFE